MRLYHGTTYKAALHIKLFGSKNSLYVTRYRPLAIMYAIIVASENDDVPAVVVIKTNKPLRADPEHAPIPSDKAYILEGTLSPKEVVSIQTNPEWTTHLRQYERTGIIDEDIL